MDFSGSDSPRRRWCGSAFAAYGLAWLWVAVFGLFLALTSAMRVSSSLDLTFEAIEAFPQMRSFFAERPFGMLFMLLVFAPVFEEAVFRVLPLSFALVVGSLLSERNSKYARDFVQVTSIVVCGIVFGFLHGGPINVFIQGVVGLVLGRLYLRHSASPRRAYLACVLVHAMYNFTTLAVSA